MAIVKFVVFFIVIAFSLSWLASRLLGEKFTAAKGNLQRPVSAILLAVALAAAYLLTFHASIDQERDCPPSGPGIHSGGC